MLERRVIALCGLVALSSCSLLAKGKASVGGAHGAGSPGGVASAPAVKADDDDPPHVRAALEQLDKLAEMIEQRDFAHYAPESRRFQGTFIFHHGWEGEKKHDAMKARLDALDAQAFQAFGGRLAAVGDAQRVLKLDDEAVEAAVEAVAACHKAASQPSNSDGDAANKVAQATASYEKALARAVKADPSALHYYGEQKSGGSVDVPTVLMECEVEIAGTSTQVADDYVPEATPKTETEKGCGVIEWLADGVQLGARSFAPYTRTAGGNSFVERKPCNKMVKKNRYPRALLDAAKDFADHVNVKLGDLVIVTDGKPYTEVNEEDLHVYRYQKLLAYSKAWEFSKNPCGGDKVFCEAGGSQAAAAYNRLEHELARAAVHAGAKPELCKAHLKEARARAAWFEEFHTRGVKSGDWIAGATYKTKRGEKLKERDLIAAFADKGKLADDHLVDKYCTRPAASDAK
jgi:hypothetical protein